MGHEQNDKHQLSDFNKIAIDVKRILEKLEQLPNFHNPQELGHSRETNESKKGSKARRAGS